MKKIISFNFLLLMLLSSCDTDNYVEAVDIGLSVKWANVNLGASRPEKYGEYFAWGEVKPKRIYTKDTYKLWNTRISDNNANLEHNYDVATVRLGDKWRIPTADEIYELVATRENANYTWEWKSINGRAGWNITYLVNMNSIFLPAAGSRIGSSLHDAGLNGLYWSSSLDTDTERTAYSVYFNSNVSRLYSGTYDAHTRYYGYSVRPVYGDFSYVSGVSVTPEKAMAKIGDNLKLKATITPYNAPIKKLKWISSNESVATVSDDGIVTIVGNGRAKITVKTIDGCCTATCAITGVYAFPKKVDLGLSVKWASFNVGASASEEYGDYFAWGEVEPKPNYTWSTYKWCEFGNCFNLTYYDGESEAVLDHEDDASVVYWGASWRMPSPSECQELLDNCTKTWTMLNGVYGRKFTSNVPGYKGKWIFFPAAGSWDGTSHRGEGYGGFYWSYSLKDDYPQHAYNIYFNSDEVYLGNGHRYRGYSVRPVSE